MKVSRLVTGSLLTGRARNGKRFMRCGAAAQATVRTVKSLQQFAQLAAMKAQSSRLGIANDFELPVEVKMTRKF